MKYKLNFEFWNINVDNLKEKEINKITWILSQSLQSKNISLYKYGELKFNDDDIHHYHPIVDEQEVFNRRKTNCAIYNMNLSIYDKLFLYHTNGKKVSNYGYVLYNSKTKNTKHRYFISDDLNDIIMHINRDLSALEVGDDFTMFHRKEVITNVGYKKTRYTRWNDGRLDLNDWARKEMSDLPIVFKSKAIYRFDNTEIF